ncbi:MAG: VWA domain-containing protein, partial [Planctomycetes bacterium]|nr:VWA domain-containing protein [Planctomycetota bacterium]
MTARFSFRARLLSGFVVLTLVTQSRLHAAERTKAKSFAQIFSYSAQDGQTYFALSLKAKALPADARPHDHVVLVDTSASQSGEHRKQAFAVVKSFLGSLPKGDRVKLYAVDMKAEPLMAEFAAADNRAVRKALAALRRRFPAGATNMLAAMKTATKAFDGKRLASVLYVGDGMSAANLIQSPQMRELVKVLRQKRIAVHSYAVGPRKDLHLLGVLAQQTGGVVRIDTVDDVLDRPAVAGRKLAEACTAPILYPTALTLKPDVRLLPGKPLPMRSDRETIYLGKGVLKGDVRITLTTADQKTLKYQISRKQFNTGHSYLHALWNRAERSNGLSVSLAGNHLLHAAHDDFTQQIARLVRLGKH